MTGLLVSVRDADEALAALEGGADLIDVKEPSRGPLGRADDAVIREVVRAVAGRRAISAALGELSDALPFAVEGVSLVKCGLAGQAGRDWRRRWLDYRTSLPAGVGLVAVAYADAERCGAPAVAEVAGFAEAERAAALLIDTAVKDGLSARLSSHLRWDAKPRMPLALAGSLDIEAIRTLAPIRPQWFAVRGAACIGGRNGRIDIARVRALAAIVAGIPN